MKNLSGLAFLFLSMILMYSCSNNSVNTEDTTSALTQNRGMKSKKALKFKSLANFENGNANISLEDLEKLNDKNLSFVVFYDSEADWANVFNSGVYEKTGNEDFNNILSNNSLVISEQTEFDETSEMLVLEADKKMDNPINAAKEISKIPGVLMVHLKDNTENTTETADND